MLANNVLNWDFTTKRVQYDRKQNDLFFPLSLFWGQWTIASGPTFPSNSVSGPDCSVKSFICGKFNCRLAKVLVNSLTWLKLQPEFGQCQTESAWKLSHWCLSVQTKASPLALLPLLRLHVCISLSHTPGSSLFFISRSLSVFLSLLVAGGHGLLQWLSRLESCLSVFCWGEEDDCWWNTSPGSHCVPLLYRDDGSDGLLEARCYFTCATISPV